MNKKKTKNFFEKMIIWVIKNYIYDLISLTSTPSSSLLVAAGKGRMGPAPGGPSARSFWEKKN